MSARSRCEMQSNGGFQVEVVGTGSIFVGRASSEDNEKGGESAHQINRPLRNLACLILKRPSLLGLADLLESSKRYFAKRRNTGNRLEAREV